MCRNIKTLFNFDPPATDEEIRAASLQFVRKLSGFNAPSKANEAAFNRAIEDVAKIARRLIDSLTTTTSPRNREEMAAQARARWSALVPADVGTLSLQGQTKVAGIGFHLTAAAPSPQTRGDHLRFTLRRR